MSRTIPHYTKDNAVQDSDKPMPATIEVQGRTFYYDPDMGVYRNAQYANTSLWDRYGWLAVIAVLAAIAIAV